MAASDYIKSIAEARGIIDTMGVAELSIQRLIALEQAADPDRHLTARARMQLEIRARVFAAIIDGEAELTVINAAKDKAYAALKPLNDFMQNTPAWVTAYRQAFEFCEITMMARDRIIANPVPYNADRLGWPLEHIEAALSRADCPFSDEEKTTLLKVLQ
jgi:ABC-type proline/glycine betaine transport system permease subunit